MLGIRTGGKLRVGHKREGGCVTVDTVARGSRDADPRN